MVNVSKFGDWLDIREYGPTADWGAALNWALAISDQVWIPQAIDGPWPMASEVIVGPNQTVAGVRESVIELTSPAARFRTSGGRATFDGFTITDPNKVNTSEQIFVLESPEVEIRNMWFRTGGGHAVKLNGQQIHANSDKCRIIECVAEDFDDRGFFANWNAPDLTVSQCRTRNTGREGIYIGFGSHESIVSSNTVEDAGFIGVVAQDSNRVIISDNQVRDCALFGISNAWNDYGTCTGNIVERCVGAGIENAGGIDTIISNNTINDPLPSTTGAFIDGVGITVTESLTRPTLSTTIVTGNTIRNANSHGIHLIKVGKGNIVANNRFVDCADYEIFVVDTPYTIISDNWFEVGKPHQGNIIVGATSSPSVAVDNMGHDPNGLLSSSMIIGAANLAVNHDNVLI